LIVGKVLFTDSTHMKANANKRKHILQQVPASTRECLGELEKAVAEDREEHEKNLCPGGRR
jgi:hypothetical protein